MMEEQTKTINVSIDRVRFYVSQVYFHLFLGLFITGLVSFLAFKSGLTLKLAMLGKWVFLGLGILGLVLVIAQSFAVRNVPLSMALYYLFSILEGITISPIFYIYTMNDISLAFIYTSLFFLGLWFVAKSNVIDLRNKGGILLILLLVGIVASIINIFLGSPLLNTIITWFLLGVFAFLTIKDLQTLEELAETGNPYFGALSLYLDLINIFLLILEILGGKRED